MIGDLREEEERRDMHLERGDAPARLGLQRRWRLRCSNLYPPAGSRQSNESRCSASRLNKNITHQLASVLEPTSTEAASRFEHQPDQGRIIMVCLALIGCQDGHRSAMDSLLTLLVIIATAVTARLLVCAVARCLCEDDGAAAHHHHLESPDTSDADEDVEAWDRAGLALFRNA
ncbi:hypothetical protein EJB05_47944, partial [Eragrostis curvula]